MNELAILNILADEHKGVDVRITTHYDFDDDRQVYAFSSRAPIAYQSKIDMWTLSHIRGLMETAVGRALIKRNAVLFSAGPSVLHFVVTPSKKAK
jgi:hypothetical protein